MFENLLSAHRLSPERIRVDPYGYDPDFHKKAIPVLDFLYRDYFHSEVWGMDGLDLQQPAILVSNHAGFLPIDALMLQHAVFTAKKVLIRPLLEDVIITMPFAAGYLPKLGFARASRDNALQLLKEGSTVLTFPEGIKGLEKTVKESCQVKRFGRGGVIKLAMLSGAPIVPVAIAGPGQAYPMLLKFKGIGRMLGLPFLPITPIFPWLGPLGLLPIPVPLQIRIGEPIKIRKRKDEAEEPFILRLNELLRSRVKSLLGELMEKRQEKV